MARTLVAVGTSSDADMFFTTAAAAPRSTCALFAVRRRRAAGGRLRLGGRVRVVSAPWRQPCLSAGSWRAASASARLGPERASAPAVRPARPVARRRSTHWCRRPVPGSSRPRIHASWDRPRRDRRGTCGTSPRPTIRSARMVKCVLLTAATRLDSVYPASALGTACDFLWRPVGRRFVVLCPLWRFPRMRAARGRNAAAILDEFLDGPVAWTTWGWCSGPRQAL